MIFAETARPDLACRTEAVATFARWFNAGCQGLMCSLFHLIIVPFILILRKKKSRPEKAAPPNG
jgi:hypothetical protein